MIKKNGFTLIELLVVIGIIIVLMGLTSAGVMVAVNKSKVQKAQTEIMNLLAAIRIFKSDIGFLPNGITSDFLGQGLSKQDVYGSTSTTIIFGPYFEFKDSNSTESGGIRTLVDPWGQPYLYHMPGSTPTVPDGGQAALNNGFPIIYSEGPSAGEDICSWH